MKGIRMRRIILFGLMAVLCLLLTGCGESPATLKTLIPSPAPGSVPTDDSAQSFTENAVFYLPSRDGTTFAAIPETVRFSLLRPEADTLAQLLLAHGATTEALSLGETVQLSLYRGMNTEVSGGVITVNLAAAALKCSNRQIFKIGQAFANTLDMPVNLLICDVRPGLDVAANMTNGCFIPNRQEDASVLYDRACVQTAHSMTAALYTPVGEQGVLCAARTISFTDISLGGMAQTLLRALSLEKGCPDYAGMLDSEVYITEGGDGRCVHLCFSEPLSEMQRRALVYTMSTFLPGIDLVDISDGNEHWIGKRGEMDCLLGECVLYVPSEEKNLIMVRQPLPHYDTCRVRAVYNALTAYLPGGLRDADLLGISFENGILKLNFSNRFAKAFADLTGAEEKQAIYSIVNTFCALDRVKRVAIYVNGTQPETLAGSIYLPGDFLPNEDIVIQRIQ